jgi:hypothetical protein
MKARIFLLTIIGLLALAVLIVPFNQITSNAIKETPLEDDLYSYTKAICNETNFCRDHEIICNRNETISVTPMTGAFIQHDKNWEDPRDQKTIEKICD